MKEYYIIKEEKKQGAFSLDELKNQIIYPETLVWKEGWDDWKEAAFIPELKSILKKSPPPIPKVKKNHEEFEDEYVPDQSRYDYSKVEDIAGVNYKPAAIISLCYVISNVLLSGFMLTTKFGLLLNGGIPFVIWWYFKRFFINLDDKSTAKFINWVFAGYAVFAPLFMYTLFNGWDERFGRTIGEFLVNVVFGFFTEDFDADTTELESLVFVSKLVFYSFLLIIIFLWIAGIKILTINKRYNFPLKRIAFSTMIFIPIHMFYLLGHAVINKVPDSMMMNIIAMIPYILICIHFYRADREDATPN